MSINEHEKASCGSIKEPPAQVSSKRVDEAAILAGDGDELDPVEAKRVRQKIDRIMLPMMCGMLKDTCNLIRSLTGFFFSSLLGSVHGQGRLTAVVIEPTRS